MDVQYTIDNLNRLVKAKEGTWNGSSITSMTREQLWQSSRGANMLDQLGNWEHAWLNLNGDADYTDTVGSVGEYDDDRTHNTVNELTGRDDGGALAARARRIGATQPRVAVPSRCLSAQDEAV